MEQSPSIKEPLLSLQYYPNKQLLSRSKISKFTTNSQLFEQRCTLLAEVCYFLLKLEIEKQPIYLSKTMYLNTQGLLFILYSFDDKFQDRLRVINPGNLPENIMEVSKVIFNWEEGSENVEDLELSSMYKQVKKMLANFVHPEDQNEYEEQWEHMEEERSSNMFNWIKNKLENSALFKQYCFPLKFDSTMMMKQLFIARKGINSQIMKIYIQLLDTQERFFRVMYYDPNFKEIFGVYGDKMILFFKLMEDENYLRILHCKESVQKHKKRNDNLVFQMQFISKLRKIQCSSFSTHQNSQQSQGNEGQERQNVADKKNYLQILDQLKNQIHFKIVIKYHQQQHQFKVDIEAASQWVIDEYYYSFFQNLWDQFFNIWHSSSFEKKDESQEDFIHKFQLSLKEKNPVISSRFYLTDRNLFREIISVIDRITILFLLFENTLKNLYKANHSLKEYQKLSLDHIENKIFIEGLLSLFGKVIKEYVTFEKTFQQIDNEYLQK